MELIIAASVTPILGGLFGLLAGKWGGNKALKACVAAKEACNHQLQDLRDVSAAELGALRALVMTSEGRILALERSLDKDAGCIL